MPVWFSLPADVRHRFYVAGLLADTMSGEGIAEWTVGHPPAAAGLLTLVAGAVDEQVLRRPAVYLEHGAGQTYPGDPIAADHPAYNGTSGHDRTRLFLCPSETVAGRWQARYPHVPAVAVGCPRLDRWHKRMPPPPREAAGAPTLAVTFHANNVVCPETRPAWSHYANGLPAVVAELRRQGWRVIGHGHPRLWRRGAPDGLYHYWNEIGVEPVESIDQVLARADVLAVDNSSVGVEFASLGRPVIWLNAPWYRREVTHGGRFWEWTEGQIAVDGPEELPAAVAAALDEPAGVREARERMVASVYVATDGQAARRAAAAILGLDETRV